MATDRDSAIWWEAEAKYKSGAISLAEKTKVQAEAHDRAEQTRSTLGYTGGVDGVQVQIINKDLFEKTKEALTNATPGELVGGISEETFRTSRDFLNIANLFGNSVSDAIGFGSNPYVGAGSKPFDAGGYQQNTGYASTGQASGLILLGGVFLVLMVLFRGKK